MSGEFPLCHTCLWFALMILSFLPVATPQNPPLTRLPCGSPEGLKQTAWRCDFILQTLSVCDGGSFCLFLLLFSTPPPIVYLLLHAFCQLFLCFLHFPFPSFLFLFLSLWFWRGEGLNIRAASHGSCMGGAYNKAECPTFTDVFNKFSYCCV